MSDTMVKPLIQVTIEKGSREQWKTKYSLAKGNSTKSI
jgi:hypothetical protein